MEIFKSGDIPKYTINQVSQITNLSKPTIRYYEDIGLLSDIKRDKNNIRMFSDNNVSRLTTIQCLRNTGFGIEIIRNYFELSSENAVKLKDRYLMILEHEELLLQKKYDLEKQLTTIQNIKLKYEEDLRNK
ncbi:MerR family transcriptional regulator [Clostridium beijerinckii]|uniref:MerR family transcriptional regulator n=1 Tax=Clostridium beijerinckii TaxID=1520 RepID=UPI0003D31C84|nr:MerR family transcriptional regulator [Clostridium beijerinckii]ALB45248.1 MerR family transcriptional regulator [Clostridium beijerinckii NRRL B-598]